MKKNSPGINGLRAICSILIIMFHFELYYSLSNKPIFSASYIAVEFFFILSGFLVCKSYVEKNRKNVSDAISTKVKKMYPAYITALIMLVSIYAIKWHGFNYLNWFNENSNNTSFISELFMVQTTGVAKFIYLNGPAWYVSALIINTGIIVALTNIFKKFSKYIFLIISIGIYSYFFINDYSMSPNYFVLGIISSAILRGLAGMSLGCFIYFINQKHSSLFTKMNNYIFNALEIIMFVFFMSLTLFRTPDKFNFLILIPSALLILMMFSKDGILDKFLGIKPLKWLGIISFEMYIFQSPCSNIINCWFSNMKQPYITMLYLLINVTTATIFYLIYKSISKIRSKKNEV